MRYIVKRYYRAGAVEYQAGQVLVIDDPEYAAWLARDMRGMLEPVVEVKVDPEPVIEVKAAPATEVSAAPVVVRAPARKRKAR